MRARSFDVPPIDAKPIHKCINPHISLNICGVGQMGIASGGQNAVVTEDFLNLQQVNTRFNQMGSVAVA